MGSRSARGKSQNINRNNLTRLPTRDRDQYRWSDYHCAKRLTGGWWYAWCTNVHITGQHTDRRTTISGDKQIYYYYGGERGNTRDSWAEAEMVLVPNWAFDPSPLLDRRVLSSFDVIYFNENTSYQYESVSLCLIREKILRNVLFRALPSGGQGWKFYLTNMDLRGKVPKCLMSLLPST